MGSEMCIRDSILYTYHMLGFINLKYVRLQPALRDVEQWRSYVHNYKRYRIEGNQTQTPETHLSEVTISLKEFIEGQ